MKGLASGKLLLITGIALLCALAIAVLGTFFIRVPVRNKADAIAVGTRILEERYPSSFDADDCDVTAEDSGDAWTVDFWSKDILNVADGYIGVKVSKQDRNDYEILR